MPEIGEAACCRLFGSTGVVPQSGCVRQSGAAVLCGVEALRLLPISGAHSRHGLLTERSWGQVSHARSSLASHGAPINSSRPDQLCSCYLNHALRFR